jgi:hypothetical protein
MKATKKELEIARKAFKSMKITKVIESNDEIIIEVKSNLNKPIILITNYEQDL